MGLHRKRTKPSKVDTAAIAREFAKPPQDQDLVQFLEREDISKFKPASRELDAASLMPEIDDMDR